jgi:hypothetical protein
LPSFCNWRALTFQTLPETANPSTITISLVSTMQRLAKRVDDSSETDPKFFSAVWTTLTLALSVQSLSIPALHTSSSLSNFYQKSGQHCYDVQTPVKRPSRQHPPTYCRNQPETPLNHIWNVSRFISSKSAQSKLGFFTVSEVVSGVICRSL